MEPTPPNAQKTILVVDDDASILSFVSRLLAKNYTVLSAISGAAALQQSSEYAGEIHLLLSDFQMPGMSGVDLAVKMALNRPQTKVLLMSGFIEGMLVLNEGWHFLPKPFIASQLSAIITNLLGISSLQSESAPMNASGKS